MKQRDLIPVAGRDPGVHHAALALKLGDRANMVAEVTITNGGFLAIGAMVSSMLLGSAVIVWAARQPRGARADKID